MNFNLNLNKDKKQTIDKQKQKSLAKWTNITSIYNSDSPIFIEIFKIINEENLNEVWPRPLLN
jgi:hypothetical protein